MLKFLGKLLVFVVFFIQLSASEEDCGAPKEYPNALLLNPNANTKYRHAARVLYTCALGYRHFSGSNFIRCVNGQWTQLRMRCKRNPCGSAGAILNGHFDYMGQEDVLGNLVVALCQEGYRLKGNRYRLCQDSGWNGEIPSCEEGVEITCPSPSVDHGVKTKGDAAVYNRGNNVTFICTDGFSLRGSQEITCGSNGQWHPKTPECVPSNANVNLAKPDGMEPTDEDLSRGDSPSGGCSAPPNYPTMLLADHYLLQKDFPLGSQVRYTCVPGYRRSRGNLAISHCANNGWTPINLKCERKSCGSVGEILNGRYEYAGVLFGDTALAVCKEGYQIIGRNYMQCRNQGWDGKTPVCEAVKCADPPEVVNGERTGEIEGPFKYSTVISYRCRQGQLIGDREIHCTKDGTWSTPTPECNDITCYNPSVKFGRKTIGHSRQYKYRDYVSFECNEGYRLNGTSAVTCGQTGQWTPHLPQCIAITCSWPNITFAKIRGNLKYKYGKYMYVSCQNGYKLKGHKKIRCGSTGQWIPDLPECQRINQNGNGSKGPVQ